jgi:AcrR family transcriptional regulator
VESTKDRIVGASAELFRRQGYAGTGVKQIVAEANAPFGSLYHFFPGGKAELGAETIRWSGALYLQLIDAFFDPGDIVGSVERFFAGAAETVRESGYADACPIATVAGEIASTSEPLREASAEVFESWIVRTAGYLAAAGIADARARELAISLLAGLEGAFLLSRTWRTTEPLAIAGASAADAVRAALPAG